MANYIEMAAEIEKRFRVLRQMTQRVIQGSVRSLIISGAAGVGKTFTVEQDLSLAYQRGHIRFHFVKGAMSAIGLYQTLYLNRQEDHVLVIDDCDSIFYDMEALNVLKAALDTSDKRVLSWNKSSAALRKADIPNQFEFKGRVIFVTNVDIEAAASKEGKMQVHYKALLGRSVYLSLGIHTREQVFARIMQVVVSTTMLQGHGLNEMQILRLMQWVEARLEDFNELSLRTVKTLANFMVGGNDWEDLATITLLKAS